MKLVYTFTNYKGSIYRAIVAIILGLVLVLWPQEMLNYIIMVIGLLFLATGLFSLWSSYNTRQERQGGIWTFSGFGSIILGLLLLCIPETFAAIFVFVLGFMLVIGAIGQFITLAAARQLGGVSSGSYIFPVLILVAGIIVIFRPFETQETILIFFGITSMFYGVSDLLNQYSISRRRKMNEEKEKIQKIEKMEKSGDTDVEDVDYEEL